MKCIITEDNMMAHDSKLITKATAADPDTGTKRFMTKLLDSTSSLFKSVKSNIYENKSKNSFEPINELLY